MVNKVRATYRQIADTLNGAPSFVERAPGLRAALPAGHGSAGFLALAAA